jgi:hypothetical protein
MAIVITLRTANRGRSGRGRVYLGGFTNLAIGVAGVISGTTVASVPTSVQWSWGCHIGRLTPAQLALRSPTVLPQRFR